jgi:hypothetical protein
VTQTPPVQVWPLAQAPQSTELPQPSPIVPQYFAVPALQVSFTQLGPPRQIPWPPQVWSPGQAPQLIDPPGQPLPIVPQYSPPGGVQLTDEVQAASELEPPLPVTTVVPPLPVTPEPPLPCGWSVPLSTPVEAPLPPLPVVADTPDLTPAHPSEKSSATPAAR